jgi:hypothetical protein
MGDSPSFFVPAADPDNEESVYAEFADWCGCSIPSRSKRVYSITFIHDGVEWTATVGEQLKGFERGRSPRNRVSDPAFVLAIFPGNPYMVVTNHGIAENVGSEWVNPFLAGEPKSITYFSSGEEG